MRELTMMEIEAVAGAGLFSRIGAAALGGMAGFSGGAMQGGIAGGNTGGILGFGLISSLVGALWGGVMGMAQGVVYGLVNDWDPTLALFNKNTEQWTEMK
ncbi:MAG TPA: hypothetical protein VJS14_06795 [Enterobacteriaceae bacterium]|nr:hypothetical protein [Enterobacteriaceae bacterium]